MDTREFLFCTTLRIPLITTVCRQGAAVNHRAIEDMDAAVMAQIAGVVTFGDTQNRYDSEHII